MDVGELLSFMVRLFFCLFLFLTSYFSHVRKPVISHIFAHISIISSLCFRDCICMFVNHFTRTRKTMHSRQRHALYLMACSVVCTNFCRTWDEDESDLYNLMSYVLVQAILSNLSQLEFL